MKREMQRGAVVGVVVPFGQMPDVPADEMMGMVYEGDLHALMESRAQAQTASDVRSDDDKGLLERLRDAVWPFIR
jgi:hypothetical protein